MPSFPPSLRVAILGIRGVPAAHGGFESFAERLAPHLVEQGVAVTVYCQEDGQGAVTRSQWGAVDRVHIPCGEDTPMASIRFDWACVQHVSRERPDVVLLLGYNTAMFVARLRLAGIPTVINMDGIEYARAKWGPLARAWLYLNERLGCLLGAHLVADHPEIARHLATRVRERKITTIPYGADVIPAASPAPLAAMGLSPGRFVTVIARAEPENSVLEIVEAFSARRRGVKLVVLGNYQPRHSAFHAEVMAAASEEVLFPGAIYDPAIVQALRTACLFYVHGHQVGGTNPSLLEAMGAGNAVLAHDNPFNRWVVGPGALYFRDRAGCESAFDAMLSGQVDLAALRQHNLARIGQVFQWGSVLAAYASLLSSVAASRSGIQAEARHDNPFWKQHTT